MSVVYANNVSKGHVVSLIRTISSHNIENSIAEACGAAQPRSTTRRDFKYLQKEQPDIPRLWPFRATREALAYPHTHTHVPSRVRAWQVYGAVRIRVPFPLFIPLLTVLSFLLPPLSLPLGTLEKRRRLCRRSFVLSKYTLVMGHFERGRNCSRFISRALESTEEVQVRRADNRLNAILKDRLSAGLSFERDNTRGSRPGWFGGVQFVNDRCQEGMAINYGVMRLKWIETGALLFFTNATFPSLNF